MSGFDRTGPNGRFSRTTPTDAPTAKEQASLAAPTLTQGEIAKQQGYTGHICDVCGSARMKMAGHCMVCEECGSTTGCS